MTQPPQYGQPAYGYGFADPAEDVAGRWARFLGGILDGIIIVAIQAILVGPTIRWEHIGEAGYSRVEVFSRAGTLLAELAAVIIAFLYVWVQHAKWGRTIGKRVAGTRLVRAEDGGAVTWGQAAWRIGFTFLLGIIINIVTCGYGGWLALIDPAWILWDQRRQALHDKVAKTLVVKVDPADRDPYAER